MSWPPKRTSRIAGPVSMALLIALVLTMAPSRNPMTGDVIESHTDVVVGLYKDFAWQAVFRDKADSSVLGRTLESQPAQVLDRYFDKELSLLLAREGDCNRKAYGELCKLKFDPIFAAQDPAAVDLSIRPLGTGEAEVSFNYPSSKERIRLRYRLVKGDAGWRIADVIYPLGPSLKEILRN